jgi:hypothetical protein
MKGHSMNTQAHPTPYHYAVFAMIVAILVVTVFPSFSQPADINIQVSITMTPAPVTTPVNVTVAGGDVITNRERLALLREEVGGPPTLNDVGIGATESTTQAVSAPVDTGAGSLAPAITEAATITGEREVQKIVNGVRVYGLLVRDQEPGWYAVDVGGNAVEFCTDVLAGAVPDWSTVPAETQSNLRLVCGGAV